MPSRAMEPTIEKGAWIAADTVHYSNNKPRRYDVAVFWAPDVEREILDIARAKVNDETSSIDDLLAAAADVLRSRNQTVRPHLLFVKRIVGLPGETIRLSEEGLEIDGARIEMPRDLRKIFGGFPSSDKVRYGKEQLPIADNAVFVVSDNVADGVDSRHIGQVPVGNLLGRVTM
ncbi:signal peptidase I [Devosia sp. CN2-171]|uniref:signal peptidase I n=1 Tax=Devosia sp. CN2-171 TaxID=3400909 RepID=UPI003BF7ABA3